MKVKYPSKVDFWMYALIGLIAGVAFYNVYVSKASLISLAPLALVIAFIFHIIFSTYYVVEGNILTIRSSFLVNRKIDILRIQKIEDSYNPLSAPAASLDRLKITYNNGMKTLISPKDKEAFIKHLKTIQPGIVVIRRK